MKIARAVALISATVSLSTGAAAAGNEVFIGVTTRSPDLESATQKIQEALSDAMELSAVRSVIKKGTDAAPPQASAEELQRLLSDARGRYLEGDFRGAAKRTKEGVKRFEVGSAFAQDLRVWNLYTELLLVQGLAYGRLDRERAQSAAFTKLATVRPEYVPDPGLTPPKVTARYEKIRDGLLNTRVSLEIVTEPPGAKVTIDGKNAGLSPMNTELPPGTHFVSAEVGDDIARQQIDLRSAATEKLVVGTPGREAGRATMAAIKENAPETRQVELAAKAGKTVLAGLVERTAGGLVVFVAKFRDGGLEAVSGLEYRGDLSDVEDASLLLSQHAVEALRDGWAAGTENPAELRPRFFGRQVDGTQGPGPEEPSGSGAWVWIGVGSVVVAAAAAAAVGVALFTPVPNPGGLDVVVDTTGLR